MLTMFSIQFAVVLLCTLIGAQVGGVGLGVPGGIGLAVLPSGFHLQSTSPPIDVVSIIMAIVSAAAAMWASGGSDYMIRIATHVLHRSPKYTTPITPAVTYTLIVLAGTGHVACSVLPAIAGVGRRNGIRPSRPLTMMAIASQFTIVASPIATAVAAYVSMPEPQHATMADMLKATVPSVILGIGSTCAFVNKLGKELKDDPHYQTLLKDPNYVKEYIDVGEQKADITIPSKAKLPVGIFLTAASLVVVMGALSELCPVSEYDGAIRPMSTAHTTEIVTSSTLALTILTCKPNDDTIARGSVFHAGMRAAIAVFGIAWLGDTLMNGHLAEVESIVSHLVESTPWTFTFALFTLSVLVNGQSAMVVTLSPIVIKLSALAPIIIDIFAAANGCFFIPDYGSIITSIDFDVIGSTGIGKYILNHSFMIPGLLSMALSLAFGLLLVRLYY